MSSSCSDDDSMHDDSSSDVNNVINTQFVTNDKECSICSEDFDNPIKLVCGHVYCFLCLKGSILNSTKECPLCRNKFSKTFLYDMFHHPEKLCIDFSVTKEPDKSEPDIIPNITTPNIPLDQSGDESIKELVDDNSSDDYTWVYSSKSNAWWIYDKKAILELEFNYEKWQKSTDKTKCYSMMICGLLLDIDFNNMIQINTKNNSHRDIKRLITAEYKQMCDTKKIIGVSGIVRKNKVNK